MTIMQAIAGGGEQDADGQANSALSTGKMDLQSPGLDKKVRNCEHTALMAITNCLVVL
jgi:hypothetical protein